jgi:hypothetical protein
MNRSKTIGNPQDNRATFDRVVKTYIECGQAPLLKAVTYGDDDGERITPTRSPGSITSQFLCDVEIAVKRTLTTGDLLDEWDRLVQEAIAESEPAPVTAATNRVVNLIARVARKKKLNLSYFRTIKRRAA